MIVHSLYLLVTFDGNSVDIFFTINGAQSPSNAQKIIFVVAVSALILTLAALPFSIKMIVIGAIVGGVLGYWLFRCFNSKNNAI